MTAGSSCWCMPEAACMTCASLAQPEAKSPPARRMTTESVFQSVCMVELAVVWGNVNLHGSLRMRQPSLSHPCRHVSGYEVGERGARGEALSVANPAATTLMPITQQ